VGEVIMPATTSIQKPKIFDAILFLMLSGFNPPALAQTDSGFLFEFNLSRFSFDDEVFVGTTPHLGITVGYGFGNHYEVGFISEGNFLFSPSVQKPSNLDPDEMVDTNASMLYVKRYWPLKDKISLYAMFGVAEVQIESEVITSVCLIFCGSLININTMDTYDGKDRGPAWGTGVQWELSPNRAFSLRYIDFATGTPNHSSFSLVWQGRFNG
jgi:opacity protein-like surface antigen